MNSKEIKQQAEELMAARAKVLEAMDKASAVFEKTVRTLYAGGDDNRRANLEKLGATIKELREIDKVLGEQACILIHEAGCAARAEEEDD